MNLLFKQFSDFLKLIDPCSFKKNYLISEVIPVKSMNKLIC